MFFHHNDEQFPNESDVEKLLPRSFDVYAIATQECGQSINEAFIQQSKSKDWEKLILKYLGSNFQLIANETLVAINLILIATKELTQYYVTNILCDSIATGMGGLLGNKGAVGISICLQDIYFLFLSSHFQGI